MIEGIVSAKARLRNPVFFAPHATLTDAPRFFKRIPAEPLAIFAHDVDGKPVGSDKARHHYWKSYLGK